MKNEKKNPDYFTDYGDDNQWEIAIFVFLYIVLSILVIVSARSHDVIQIHDAAISFASFTGVFSSLANICLIMMVLYYKKLGFIGAVALLCLQFPIYVQNVFIKHSYSSMPGLFSSIATIFTIVVIYNSHKRIENEKNKLRRLFEQSVATLVNAIDAKDKYTHGHSSRVAEYSMRLAELEGKTRRECNEIYFAGMLHDVGKIGIPINIINKVGKLTEEEYDIIKDHPVKGGNILKSVTEYPFLSLGAKYHHERYDGKGYPDGLKGESIPELARIIAVADAYDAMTSKRSYRDILPQDKVREEFEKCAGTQFDPKYAKLMVELIDRDTEYMMRERV